MCYWVTKRMTTPNSPRRIVSLLLGAFTLVFMTCGLADARQMALRFSTANNSDEAAAIAILTTAYEKLNISFESVPLPMGRGVMDANLGVTDGEVIRSEAIELTNPDLIRVNVPLLFVELMAFVCTPEVQVTDWESLVQYRVGIRNGNLFCAQATAGFPKVTKLKTPDQLFDLLVTGRLDVVVVNPKEGPAYARKTQSQCIKGIQPPLSSFPLYHYLNRRHAHIVPQLEKVLTTMRANGEMKQLTAQIRQEHSETP